MNPLGPAIVINIDGDDDRLERTHARLAAQGISFTRVAGVKPPPTRSDSHTASGHFGCALSHRTAIQHAMKMSWPRVLVFEDDCVVRDDFASEILRVAEELEEVEYGVLHLGARCDRLGGRVTHRVWELDIGWHTHCYSVDASAYARVVAWIDRTVYAQNWTFDCFRIPGLKRFVVQPLLAVQEPGISRIDQKRIDRMDEYFPTRKLRDAFAAKCAEMRSWR